MSEGGQPAESLQASRVAWAIAPGAMLAVPEMNIRRSPAGEVSSMARLKALP